MACKPLSASSYQVPKGRLSKRKRRKKAATPRMSASHANVCRVERSGAGDGSPGARRRTPRSSRKAPPSALPIAARCHHHAPGAKGSRSQSCWAALRVSNRAMAKRPAATRALHASATRRPPRRTGNGSSGSKRAGQKAARKIITAAPKKSQASKLTPAGRLRWPSQASATATMPSKNGRSPVRSISMTGERRRAVVHRRYYSFQNFREDHDAVVTAVGHDYLASHQIGRNAIG